MQKSLLHTYEVCKIGYVTGTCLRRKENFYLATYVSLTKILRQVFAEKKPCSFALYHRQIDSKDCVV